MGAHSDRLRDAYRIWNDSKGARTDAWLSLLSDGVRIRSTGGGGDVKALAFSGRGHSKTEAVEYLSVILKDWTMVHWTPLTFVEEGDRVAVFGRCGWTFKATGKTAEVEIAHLWRFERDRIAEFNEVFDTAGALAATVA